MSITEVLAELPALSVEERQLLVRRALDLDEPSLSLTDEAEIDRRLSAHQDDPASALSLDVMQARIRARFDA